MITRRNLFQGAIGAQALLASMAEAASPGVNVKALMNQKIDALDRPLVFMEEVTFGPGAESSPHRHPGPVFGYVLEGELSTQVEGGQPATFKTGEVFFEPAGHVHVMARNPNKNKPVRFLAVVIGKQGSPSVLPK